MTFIVKFTRKAFQLAEKLTKRDLSVKQRLNRMVQILREDPYNLSRQHDIQKLTNEPIGAWRIRIGKYRMRYDIEKDIVVIHDVFHRKKGY